MRDFIGDLMDEWRDRGAQEAYDLGAELLQEIAREKESLRRHEEAIQALGEILRSRDDVDTSTDPADTDPALDAIDPALRPRLILDAALEVWRDKHASSWLGPDANLVRTDEVLQVLHAKGLDLGVQQPNAVIGTVLSSADGYTRIARNTFERNPGVLIDEDADDLPW